MLNLFSDTNEDEDIEDLRGFVNYGKNMYDKFYPHTNEFCLWVGIPSFKRYFHVEKFFDWTVECDRLKDYINVSEERMMKLVAIQIKGRSVFLMETPSEDKRDEILNIY